jgi:hypothetical protein
MTNTNEVTTTETASDEKLAKKYANKTKRAFSAIRKNNTTLFVSIREAYDAIFDTEHKWNTKENSAWQHYRVEVLKFCDKSSFNKIFSICQNDLIMSNLDRLPVAWSTLSTIDVLLKTDDEDETVADLFVEYLDADKITVTSTAKSIVDLFRPETEPADPVSEEPKITYDSSVYSDEQLEQIQEAFSILEALGFVIEDAAEVSEEVSEEEADASSDDLAEAA